MPKVSKRRKQLRIARSKRLSSDQDVTTGSSDRNNVENPLSTTIPVYDDLLTAYESELSTLDDSPILTPEVDDPSEINLSADTLISTPLDLEDPIDFEGLEAHPSSIFDLEDTDQDNGLRRDSSPYQDPLEGPSNVEDEDTSKKYTLNELMSNYSRDWIETLSRDDQQSLSITLHHVLVNELNFQLTNASELIGRVLDKGERTVRRWRGDFYSNNGSFSDSLQGKYQRTGVLWKNEEMNKLATRFVRENAAVKGRPNLKLSGFARWINEDLLPNHSLEPGYPRKVGIETARTWLHELGFNVIHAKKGTYVDGHERKDVVEYRSKFLRKMVALGFLNKENAPTPEAEQAIPTDLESPSAHVREKTIILFHDESTFQANDYERTQWGTDSDYMVVPKSRGAGIMVSDFICERDGYLRLTEEEFSAGQRKFPGLQKKDARQQLEYGENKEGYWTSEKFMQQLEHCVLLTDIKYPREEGFKVVWVFNHSSCHGAYSEDALNASKMNAKPGGKQPLMRDTVWNGKPQSMVFSIGVAKGLIQVLRERGKYTPGMKLDDMREELASHSDFLNEKTKIEHFLNSKGYACMFLPKFHAELNPIERCWAQAKRYAREHCSHSIVGLRRIVPLALECATLENIHNHFRKVRHYMFGYLQGISGGPELEKIVKYMKKVYTSHRRVGVND